MRRRNPAHSVASARRRRECRRSGNRCRFAFMRGASRCRSATVTRMRALIGLFDRIEGERAPEAARAAAACSRRTKSSCRRFTTSGDKKGRNSLVWDAIEPLCSVIDARVFAFIAQHEFARCDFPQSGYNVHRLSRDVTQLLLHRRHYRRARSRRRRSAW